MDGASGSVGFSSWGPPSAVKWDIQLFELCYKLNHLHMCQNYQCVLQNACWQCQLLGIYAHVLFYPMSVTRLDKRSMF